MNNLYDKEHELLSHQYSRALKHHVKILCLPSHKRSIQKETSACNKVEIASDALRNKEMALLDAKAIKCEQLQDQLDAIVAICINNGLQTKIEHILRRKPKRPE